MKYPEPKRQPQEPEGQSPFDHAQAKLKTYAIDTYFEDTAIQERQDIASGKAIVCPVNHDCCELEDCQTTCHDKGCTHLKACWNTK